MKRFLTYLLLLVSVASLAEETIIVGTVRDGSTGLPVVNANVYFKNTDIGCATNDEGLFFVRTDLKKKRTLLVSAIGYKTQKYQIEPGQYAGIEVELEEQNTELQDVFVVPGENPALALMSRVRERRKENDIICNPAVSYTTTEQKSLFISDIRQKHLKRLLWKSLSEGMLAAQDSSLLIPLYYARSQYHLSANRKTPLSTPDVHTLMLTETDYQLLLEGLPEQIDFYQNTVSIFSCSFISPLASYGNNYYNYFLADSISTDTAGKIYIVHFKSKNPYEPSFNGEMQIDSATCALRDIEVTVPREVGVNYLASLQLRQTYDSNRVPEKENLSMIFDFAIKADTSHVFPTVLLQRSIQTMTTALGATYEIESADSLFIEKADSAMLRIEDAPVIRFAKTVAHIVNTGNIPTGEKVDIGNVVEIMGGSREEGFHLGVPLTTNEKLWKNVELSGYAAYGFRDRALKGKGQVRVLLPTERRHLFGAYYSDSYVRTDESLSDCLLRENSIFYGGFDFTYRLFSEIRLSNNYVTTRTRRREGKIWWEAEWNDVLETDISFQLGTMGYGSPFVGYHNIPYYNYRTLQATVRLGWQERKIDFFMRRYHAHSNLPVVRLVVEAGSYKLDPQGLKNFYHEQRPDIDISAMNLTKQTDNLYGRLTLQVQQTVSLGMMGRLDYSLTGGFVFGAVPYPLLEHFMGNQSFTYDTYRFTLMNTYQYAADKFVLAHFNWNMQGALFNRIPYIQRLRLRELFEVKFAYGTLSNKHQAVLPLPENCSATRVPYVEAGIGIGNILRIADLYAVFRLTDLKNSDAPWWAIRTRFSFGR